MSGTPTAAQPAAGERYRLQIAGGSQVYGPARGAAAITFSSAQIRLPRASP